MAIRKRAPGEQAKIEAFGAAADAPAAEAAPSSAASRPSREAEDASKISPNFLVRWGANIDLAVELAEIAKKEDLSRNKVAIRVLRRGLEAMRKDIPN